MKRFLFILLLLVFIMCVPIKPKLVLDKDTLAFSNNPDGTDVFQLTFTIKTQDSTEAIPWAIDDSQVDSWLDFSSKSGTATPLTETITVTVKEPVPTENKNGVITISSTTEGIDNVTINATFTYIQEKEDVYAVLFSGYDEYSEKVYLYMDNKQIVKVLSSPSGVESYTAGYILYDYNFGTETGDVYVIGKKTDFDYNDSIAIWKNGVYNATLSNAVTIPAGATEVEIPSNSGGHNGVVKVAGILNGQIHLITWASVPNNFTHYWNGSSYPTLPTPTPVNGYSDYKLVGLKRIGDAIYIFGYLKEGTSWIANELKPLVWKNDGTNITLYENFPTCDTVSGVSTPAGGYRDFNPKDITVDSNGDILFVAMFGQDTTSTPNEAYKYYTGIFKSDGTYRPIGPNNGVYDAQGSTDDQPIMTYVANATDYLRILRGESREDEVYLNDVKVTMESPQYYIPIKAIGYVRMLSDGEDTYLFGSHEHDIDGIPENPYTNKIVIYRNTKIKFQSNEMTINSSQYEVFSSLDMDVPLRPSSK